ncbi:MAG: hypothetical protein QHJ73_08590, partial [Armatimonadota bacterium]|nr:hypothetical protein [Armatimonadota bacterium]
YEEMATALAPFAADTAAALFPFALATLWGATAEIVRPGLTRQSPLSPDPAALSDAPPIATDEAPTPDAGPGPNLVDALLSEFEHLGCDGLASDLVEAALVLFPNEEQVRSTLSLTRKQVLDAILAREFPQLRKSARMQIVVVAEPRGLRLNDISELAKMVTEGEATVAEVRALLRSTERSAG